MNFELIQYIDKSIKEIWTNEICEDYTSHSILKEDSLKNALYHHLRARLDGYKKDNIRIFTEFSDNLLKGTGVRADVAIVKLKDKLEMPYLGDDIEEIISLIELKFNGDRCQPYQVMSDIDKAKKYIKELKMDNCQFYLGFLHECSYPIKEIKWLDKRASSTWAKGRVTELTACRFDEIGDEMQFVVQSYNDLNPDLDTKMPCGV
jgi:hypothetical protein